ncbi:hypothetical protein DFR44_10652 [Hydromonas duriensis]|uniref:Uncharacterized protein n=1 Tax=Hydromonas duriensis TaxID=1527608 RepID=A0A4R6Y968_9BURK|nr:hypothetical protein DFR44_10652 [Hydromonas duriensis]
MAEYKVIIVQQFFLYFTPNVQYSTDTIIQTIKQLY